MKYILLLSIILLQIFAFADPDKQPSIDSTKCFVIDGDTLSVYKFWKANHLEFSLFRSESKISIKSKEWEGGEFFLELNEDRNKIILKEVINPWRPDEKILNQIESKKIELQLSYVREVGYWDNKIWFVSDSLNKELEMYSPPDIIGYFDLKLEKSNNYYSNEYYPENWDIYKGLSWTFFYKGKMIFYMDNSNYGNPTENVKILIYDGEFRDIEIW